ncbi:hypothetical protein GCM10023226_08060 [Nocardioides nanhaiensis]|uniref:Fibronectin attachment protein n=1 Tax=Nocardioides nanhaiensis TaxID=1476871 RepID=A0ABP8VW39_9ACTN
MPPPYAWGPPVPGAPPPPPPGSLHRSSRGLTIALVVVGVVAVGALGALAAVLFGGGGDDETAGPPSLSSTAEPEGGSGILDPEPIGSAEPLPEPAPEPSQPTAPSEPPTVEPTEAPQTQEPAPDPGGPDIPGNGRTVTVGPGVQVLVPVGWEVAGQGESDVAVSSGDGSFGYVLTGVDDPSTDAASVITQNLSGLLPADNYTQLDTGDVRPLEPFGSLVSVAVMDYTSLWVDAQAPIPLAGQVYAAVRSDGVVVLMTVEHTPPEDFEATVGDWGQLVDGTLGLLGGS